VGIDYAQYIKPRQEHRLRFALLPIYRPVVSVAHDGDDGGGHEVTFYPIPLMGPNRIATVGSSIDFHGEESYERGAGGFGGASGQNWRIYGPGIDELTDPEEIGSGTLVASSSAVAFSWTPSVSGTYRIELRLNGSNDETCGARFVRVFDDLAVSDLSHIVEPITGSFDVETGGYQLTVTYRPQNGASVVKPWQRIVLNIHSYYGESGIVTFADQHDFDSTVIPPGSDTVQFDGMVMENGVQEDRETETVTFKLWSPGFFLKKLPLRGYPHTVQQAVGDGTTFTVPVDYPLFFGDPDQSITVPEVPVPPGSPVGTVPAPGTINVIDFIRQSDVDIPIHEIHDMVVTDALIHVMQRHTNFCQWFDFMLDQDLATNQFPVVFQIAAVWDQLKEFQDKRMQNLYSDRKGTLHAQKDPRFQDDAWWTATPPPTQMTFSRDNIENIEIVENPYRVAQVKMVGIDGSMVPYFAQYPDTPEFVGDIITRSALLVHSVEELNTLAARLWTVWNQPYDVKIKAMGIARGLDLNDVVDIDYEDAEGFITL
jgi:hypothetical protein